jgi:hypothetical protein
VTRLSLQGAGGNITTIEAQTADPNVVFKVGKQLGCEASRVFLGLRTQPIAEREVMTMSIAPFIVYEPVPLDVPSVTAFTVRTRLVELPLLPLPTLDEAESALAISEGQVRDLRTAGASRADLNPPIYHLLWARRVAEMVRSGIRTSSVTAEVQVIRINDIALVAVPGEAFVEMALTVKSQSPIRDTFFVGYSNGAIGYIPTREAYPLGGYEVLHAHRGYGLPSALQPGSAERLVEVALELLHQVADSPQQPSPVTAEVAAV